jgi:excisionase family DNA binding protein
MTTTASEREAPEPRFMTTEEVAAYARTVASTVRWWRHCGQGPASFRVGKRVLYDRADVERWFEAQKAAGAEAVAS